MSTAPTPLEIDQNDDEILDVTVVMPDGSPADLASCQLDFVVRPSKGSDVILITKTTVASGGIDIGSPTTAGLAAISIGPDDTGDFDSKYLDRTLAWQLDVVDSLDHEITLAKGTIIVSRDLVP